jgi:hypothetical protein
MEQYRAQTDVLVVFIGDPRRLEKEEGVPELMTMFPLVQGLIGQVKALESIAEYITSGEGEESTKVRRPEQSEICKERIPKARNEGYQWGVSALAKEMHRANMHEEVDELEEALGLTESQSSGDTYSSPAYTPDQTIPPSLKYNGEDDNHSDDEEEEDDEQEERRRGRAGWKLEESMDHEVLRALMAKAAAQTLLLKDAELRGVHES